MINTLPGMKEIQNLKSLAVFVLSIVALIIPFTVNADFANEIKLLASDGAAGDSFGIAVSISGNTAIIGAKDDDNSNGTDSGSAYVFVRDPATGSWTQQQKLLASDGTINDWFGRSVSISGDTAIVGAAETNDVGSAYVFVRNPATGVWTEQQKLTASDAYLWDSFGVSVSISGDTAIIGASGDDYTGGLGSYGAVYVFARNPSTGVWTEQQKLLASDGAAVDQFGWSVSISGGTLIAGTIYHNDNGQYSGSA
ncbi:MAG: hypothetical protein GXP11_04425, partial [Gammaproteobacteria bacterium]|nr:hypothetical protein [Gammaproteobacteria bacterium]